MAYRWTDGLWRALTDLGNQLTAIVPSILLMLMLVALGLGLGWLAGSTVTRITRAIGFDHHAERWGLTSALRRSGIFRAPSDLLGSLTFWAVFILFASVGIDSLGLPGARGATAFLLAFLPPLFAAVLIMIVGVLVANFLSQGLLIAAVNAGLPEARLLARVVQWGILLFAAATALTHLGVGKEMVLLTFGITFGGLVLTLALAFGLGGRTIARDMLARRLRRESPPREETLTHL